MSEFYECAAVVRLPDGRWAVENRMNVSLLTIEDLDQIADALLIWLRVQGDLAKTREVT